MERQTRFAEKYPVLRGLSRVCVTRWLPGLVLLACLATTYALWKYGQAEEFHRLESEFKLATTTESLLAFESSSFSRGLLFFAYFASGMSVLLAIFTWLILRSRDSVLSMADICRANEQRWKFALEGAGDGVWDWNVQTGEAMFSKRWKEILGFSEDEIGGSLDEWKTRIHPEDAARVLDDIEAYFDGRIDVYTNEHRLQCKDGGYKWILNRGMAIGRDEHGRPLRMIGTSSDITGARQSEEARLTHMARQRDVLVREVHHRIKNNLQGVAGLLRQHAVKEPQLGHIIDQAIAQVQTVAVVHGLQGQAFGNEVVLCEMVPTIARMVETLLQPSPVFDIRVDVPKRIRVCEQETVPIALILNELIVNAAKHARCESTAPHISITVDWDQAKVLARICIVNPGALPPEFDFISGKERGTGLDLVRSLLPPNAGQLSFISDNGQVRAVLELFAPSIYTL